MSAKCECSDVRPRVAHDGPPLPFGCAEQRRFEKCNEPFMFTTIEELAAGVPLLTRMQHVLRCMKLKYLLTQWILYT